jgi:thiamine transporter ThiT
MTLSLMKEHQVVMKEKANAILGVVIESCTKGVWSDYVMGLFQGLLKIILNQRVDKAQ